MVRYDKLKEVFVVVTIKEPTTVVFCSLTSLTVQGHYYTNFFSKRNPYHNSVRYVPTT